MEGIMKLAANYGFPMVVYNKNILRFDNNLL